MVRVTPCAWPLVFFPPGMFRLMVYSIFVVEGEGEKLFVEVKLSVGQSLSFIQGLGADKGKKTQPPPRGGPGAGHKRAQGGQGKGEKVRGVLGVEGGGLGEFWSMGGVGGRGAGAGGGEGIFLRVFFIFRLGRGGGSFPSLPGPLKKNPFPRRRDRGEPGLL